MAAPLDRETVIDAAHDMIVADGLEAVSLRKLAAALGVTAPALYAYVDDKRDLLRGVAQRQFNLLIATFEAIDEPDPIERLRRMSHAYVGHALAGPELFRTMFLFSPDLTPIVVSGAEDPVATTTFGLALAAVDEAIRLGALRPGDPLTVSLTLWAAVHGVADVVLMGFPFDDATRTALVDSVIDATIAGLRA